MSFASLINEPKFIFKLGLFIKGTNSTWLYTIQARAIYKQLCLVNIFILIKPKIKNKFQKKW